MFCLEDVKAYWDSNISRTQGRNWWRVISSHYGEPQRHYHTMNHITEMFQHWDQCKSSLQRPDLVALAILFHDVIYNPKSSDNEEKSAELFLDFAKDYPQLEAKDTDKVQDWILQTKQHKTDVHMTPGAHGCDDLHFFLDFDMAVLGRDQLGYQEYASQIRQEYIHIPDEMFNTRRPQVLKMFLKTPNIFATRDFRERYESIARQNIQDEIRRLENLKS